MRIQSVSFCHRDELWRRDIISFAWLDWHSITEHRPPGMRRLPLEPSVPVITRHGTCVRLRLGPLMCLSWRGSGSPLPCLFAPPPRISRQWMGCQEREKLVLSVIITSKLTTFLSITPHPCDCGWPQALVHYVGLEWSHFFGLWLLPWSGVSTWLVLISEKRVHATH